MATKSLPAESVSKAHKSGFAMSTWQIEITGCGNHRYSECIKKYICFRRPTKGDERQHGFHSKDRARHSLDVMQCNDRHSDRGEGDQRVSGNRTHDEDIRDTPMLG